MGIFNMGEISLLTWMGIHEFESFLGKDGSVTWSSKHFENTKMSCDEVIMLYNKLVFDS